MKTPSASARAYRVKLHDFNLRFLWALTGYERSKKDLSTGHGKHPLARISLLRRVKQDFKTEGLEKTIEKWRYFIDG